VQEYLKKKIACMKKLKMLHSCNFLQKNVKGRGDYRVLKYFHWEELQNSQKHFILVEKLQQEIKSQKLNLDKSSLK